MVTLTSHPPRYRTLALTLKCLLTQTHRPDAVVLWLSPPDHAAPPPDIVALTRHGLTIGRATAQRSFNKILPALAAFPDADLVTADDDIHYPPDWLAELAAAADPAGRTVIAHRAHRIRLAIGGGVLPYLAWEHEIAACPPEALVFPAGAGGVFYPQGVLPPEASDAVAAAALCPTADDVWLYGMARLNGALFAKVGPRRALVTWPGSQRQALRNGNVLGGGNDRQIAAFAARYGFPPAPRR